MKLSKFLLLGLLVACAGPKEKTPESGQELDQRDRIRLQQYMVKGQDLFSIYCANCHQSNGQGLAQLYPPLAKSDYLMADLPRAACIIKNGLQSEILVNGVKFNQMMPPNNLTPIEIAEILTYITNSWGNNAGISATSEVTKWLEACHLEK